MNHVIVAALRADLDKLRPTNPLADVYRFVLEHGRYYVAVERPKGFRRQLRPKQCFANATRTSQQKIEASYVEGFALKTGRSPFQHAWVTLDGLHAIDQTLQRPERFLYFGIPFTAEIVSKVTYTRGHFGLLDPFEPELVRAS